MLDALQRTANMTTQTIPSTCTECLVHCGSLIHIEDGKIKNIAGNPEHPGSQGAFCIKGMNAPVAGRESATRVTYPMRRAGARGEGRWERISWDDAFEQIALRLGAVKAAHGPLSIAGAAATFTQSRGTAVRLLLRSLGSPNFMINQDMCHGGRSTAGILTGFGGSPGSELRKARTILAVGKSPSESDIVEWKHIHEAKAQGAKLIAIDPRHTKIARLADCWIAPNVGTDAVLAWSMAEVMFREDLIDHEFVAQWCSGTDEFRARVAKYPPHVAADITGVPSETIIAAARLFAREKPGCMILGHGIDAHESAVGTAIAFYSLLALTGNVDRPGSNRGAKSLPGYKGSFSYFNQHADFQLPPDRQQQILGGSQFPLWTGPESWTQTCHNPAVLRAIETGLPYPVRALFVSGTNLACTYPDYEKTVDALKKLDLLIVAADQMTPTAELADIFLPKTTLLEEQEILMGQGEPCIGLTQKIFEPLGEARTDVEIVAGLCKVLRKHGLIEFDVFPWQSNDEFNDFVLKDSGVSLHTLRAKGFVKVPYTYENYRTAGFKTSSKKFEFAPQRLDMLGVDPMPDQVASLHDKADDEFSLVLMTGIRSMALHHSRFLDHGWARRVKVSPEISIHPKTAAKFDVDKNGWVWVQTREKAARVLLKAKLTEDVPENVVATGMGWWYPEFDKPGYGASISNIGAAMAYGPAFDPVSGSPSQSRNTICKIAPATKAEVDALLARLSPPVQAPLKKAAAR